MPENSKHRSESQIYFKERVSNTRLDLKFPFLSSKAPDVNKNIYGGMVPVLDGEKLTMRLLVDHSIVESFAQGGRTVITSRIYPTKAINGAAGAFLFNNATGVNVTAHLKIWEMDSADIQQYPFN